MHTLKEIKLQTSVMHHVMPPTCTTTAYMHHTFNFFTQTMAFLCTIASNIPTVWATAYTFIEVLPKTPDIKII